MYLEPNQHQLLTLDGPIEFIQTHGLIQGQELSMLLFSMLSQIPYDEDVTDDW